ncbi:hypothetical protein A9Q84_04000 [Halobacteriovorax marinus]|uniref:Uncharacterized protein n=1 Tax=Halobacteriovorax marinus TaxID=97084 RepID=A0A1Y5FGZ3_9BACT|nr:hypothetical protein A9Q84_04000 [Halobacteriovorax marinus]
MLKQLYYQILTKNRLKKGGLLFLMLLSVNFSSCSSYQQFQYIAEEFEIPSKLFKTNYNQAWQAVLQVMQKYDLALQSQEGGVIKTRWIDNTLQLNFADSFGSRDSVKSARFKLIVNVVKGFSGSREVSKVTVFKRQMIEQDFLQGWKVERSDGILEQSLLYRIERVITIDNKLKKIEEKRSKELEESF